MKKFLKINTFVVQLNYKITLFKLVNMINYIDKYYLMRNLQGKHDFESRVFILHALYYLGLFSIHCFPMLYFCLNLSITVDKQQSE